MRNFNEVIYAKHPGHYNQTLKKKRTKKGPIQYCDFCGTEINEETYFTAKVCNSLECKRKKLVVCEEDCFNCVYSDCIVQYKSNKNR